MNWVFDNVLYIIGNGFDCHHHINSSFYHFKEWLKRNDPETYYTYDTVCSYAKKWSDFETSMAYVNRDYLLASGELFQPDSRVNPEDWLIADIMLGGDASRGVAEELLNNLKTDLHKWIGSLHIPADYNTYKLPIDYYARFLTFNYTTFLETQYGIEKERINYIHGKKTEPWGNIVVGHGEDNEAIFDKWWKSKRYNKAYYNKKGKKYYKRDFAYKCYGGNTQYLPEIEMVTDAVESYYVDAQKDTNRIIKENESFFQSLSNIKYVYVWGFSFAKVDMPYIEKIIQVNSSAENMIWYVSYYSDEEKETFKDKLINLGVKSENIHIQKLTEIMLR